MGYEDLRALDELRRTGAITEAEYEQEKQKVLGGTNWSQPTPGAVPPPQPGYQQQTPPPPPPPPSYAAQPIADGAMVGGMRENTYLMLMHLSSILGWTIILALGFAAPIILWALKKDVNPRVDATGKRIFNFLISFFIYEIAATFLIFTLIGALIGVPVLFAVPIVGIVFAIIAAVKANNGEDWDYPLTIKFFH